MKILKTFGANDSRAGTKMPQYIRNAYRDNCYRVPGFYRGILNFLFGRSFRKKDKIRIFKWMYMKEVIDPNYALVGIVPIKCFAYLIQMKFCHMFNQKIFRTNS